MNPTNNISPTFNSHSNADLENALKPEKTYRLLGKDIDSPAPTGGELSVAVSGYTYVLWNRGNNETSQVSIPYNIDGPVLALVWTIGISQTTDFQNLTSFDEYILPFTEGGSGSEFNFFIDPENKLLKIFINSQATIAGAFYVWFQFKILKTKILDNFADGEREIL